VTAAVSPTWTTFLFEAVNFMILAGVLGWLFFDPVRKSVEARRAALQAEAERAAAATAEAERNREETRRLQASFEQDMERLRREALSAAEREAEALRAAARSAAEREREALRYSAARIERAQLEGLAEEVAVAAAGIVRRLLEALPGPDLDAALVQAACRELKASEGMPLGPVTVESSAPLSETSRAALAAALGEAAAGAEYRVLPRLAAGVRIRTARGLVDATAAGLAAYTRRALAERMAPAPNVNHGFDSGASDEQVSPAAADEAGRG
jgi:F-type H+-transporting ATPase subunit b